MKKYILLAITTLISMSMWADGTVTDANGIRYEIIGGTGTNVSVNHNSTAAISGGKAVIPASFDVTVGSTTTTYTVTGFKYWNGPDGVDIDLSATSLTEINLSNIRTNVGELSLPTTISSVLWGTKGTGGTKYVASYKVADGNATFSTKDGVLFNNAKTVLYYYPGRKSGAAYTLPTSVTEIGSYAFYDNNTLETINLPSSLTSIGDYAFYSIGKLYECILPTSLTSIGNYAFRECGILAKVGDLSKLSKLETVGQYAFYGCKIVLDNDELTLPGMIHYIGTYAFNSAFVNKANVTVYFPSTLGQSPGSEVTVQERAFDNGTIKALMKYPVDGSAAYAFSSVSTIYVPTGYLGTYQVKSGWNNVPSKLKEDINLLPENERTGTPQFAFDEKDSTVSITSSTADAVIYYTTNGDEPTEASTKYDKTKPILAKVNMTIKAIAVKAGLATANATYVVDRYVLDAVTVEPYVKSTDGNEVIFVKMSTSQADAKIYYLKDKNSTTSKSSIVSEYKESDPPSVVNNNYIHAYAVKDGYTETGITDFQIKTADITCNKPTFEYNTKEDGSVVLTFNTTTEGATINYETYDVNGSNLLVASKAYPSTGIVVDGNYTFKAKAVKDKMLSSSVTSTVSTSYKTFSATTPNVKIVASYNDQGEEVMKAVITSGSTDEAVKARETFAYRIGTSGDVNSPYSAPVTVNDGERFYAVAKVDNWTTSSSWVNPYDTYNYIYKSQIRCAAPTQTSDRDNHKVILSTTTDGADIYYTLDGTEPTLEDAKYNPETGVILKNNAKLRAMAVKADMFNSSTSEVEYNNWFTCPNVTIEQIFVDGTPKMRLSLADSTSVDVTGIQIYYKVNDWWTYADGWMEYGDTYNDQPVYVDYGNTIYAVAIKDGFTMSGRSSKSVDYSSYTRCTLPTCDFDDDNRKVILSTTEENGKIYYTVDGSIPTTASTLYTEPISSTKRCEIKAITARDPETVDEVTTVYANSDIVTISLDEWFRYDRVKFHPVLGAAENEYKMVLTAEEGTIIEYGINNYGNTLYTDTFAVEAGQYVYAIARSLTTDSIDSDWSEYYISKNSYTVSQPYVNVNSETHTMTVTCDTDGADIYYTSDGTDPTTESTKLTQSNIEVSLNGDYRFIAAKEGMHTSAISKISINWFRVPNVDIIPVVEDNVLKVKLECADPDASIYWGYNGDYESQTVTANTLYTGEPFKIEDGANIYASAVKAGYSDAYWTNSGWIYKSSYTSTTPSITVAADTTVTISSTVGNATFYYTLNGEDPTTASSKFTSKFKLSSNATIKAIAVEDGKLYSSVNTREYTGFRVSSVVITPKVIDNKLKVVLETPTPGAKIYYAINENNPTTTLNMNYTEPFEINSGDYIYANAVKEGYTEAGWSTHSWIYYSEYTCTQPTITVKADTTVVISANEGATIYYTLDGTEPTTSSTKYTSEFKLKKNGTIKAIAVEAGKMSSNIREREYSGFYVKNINFALDGIKMTLTSETPDVTFNYCYETDPREDVTGNLVYSRTYSGPFNMEYNGYIYVRATRDGYNTTESSYWVTNLVKWAKPDTLSFDGHKLKFKEIAGAKIWYTTNGDYPEANYRGTLYKDSILVSNTGVIRAIAVGDYKNQSDMAEIEIKSFASESGAVSEKAGGLATAMAWKGDLETITDYTVTGPINSDDIEFIKDKMTSLQKLDLSGATADGGIIPDNAFAGLPLVMFSSPNALQSVGKNIFTGCKDLAAVVWNTTTKIPNDAFDKDVNPNLLLFVPAEDAAPTSSSARNIIVNNTAENIYLSDGEDNNFYSPKRFYTKNITYTHDFKLTTGSAFGWETICLPFDCAYFVHESKGELKPFAEFNELSDKGSYKPFWLRELTDIGFQDARMIEANKPYIISMPNNEGYATRFRVGGKVTFSASNVYVPETVQGSAQKGDVTLYANFMNSSETSDMLLLNTEASDDHEAGSIFVLNSGRAVRPFEAYVISRARARAYISVRGLGGDDDDDATAIKERTIDGGDMVKVYNLSGVLVKQSTKEDALKGLAKGVYIVNGKRMIVK